MSFDLPGSSPGSEYGTRNSTTTRASHPFMLDYVRIRVLWLEKVSNERENERPNLKTRPLRLTPLAPR